MLTMVGLINNEDVDNGGGDKASGVASVSQRSSRFSKRGYC